MSSTPPVSRRSRWLLPLVLGLAAIGAFFAYPRLQLWRCLSVARHAIGERDYDSALRSLESARQLAPQNPETHFLLARVHRHRGELQPLQEALAQARELGFPSRRIQVEEYLLLAQNGRMAEALPQLPRLLTESAETDGQEICEAYVNGFFATYNFPEAFKLLEVWQQDYPRDPQPYFSRGLYEAHVGSDTRAVAELRKALELAPGRDDARRYLAESLIDLEQFDEAEVHIRYLVKKQPDNVELTTALGHCLLEKGDLEGARGVLEQALAMDPQSLPTKLILGMLELKDQHPEEALKWLEPIVQERPHEYNARFQYATALQHAGRGSEAVEHLKFVGEAQSALGRVRNLMDQAKDDPEDIASRLEIGLTLLKYDSPDDGANWLRNVLQLDPGNREAHRGLADYYTRKSNQERAEHHRKLAGETDSAS